MKGIWLARGWPEATEPYPWGRPTEETCACGRREFTAPYAAVRATREAAAGAGGGVLWPRAAAMAEALWSGGAGSAFERGGLHKIAQHFRSALEAVLHERGHSHAVVVEDDLLLSPDFLR